MDALKPAEIVAAMIEAGASKARLGAFDLLLRGALSGGLLGCATSLAFGAAVQTGQPLAGAVIFPVGFVMIVLLGLELVTGSFALLPLAALRGLATPGTVLRNWGWVFVGNLAGSLAYAWLFAIALTTGFHADPGALGQRLVQVAAAKTLGYAAAGPAGLAAAFVKAVLCNWMVSLGVVMALASTSTIGRIAAAWLPILAFFAQGFEHSVVNMFVIPAGILLGAKIGLAEWWLWNQIPVTLGNLAGGFVLTGLALYATYARGARTLVRRADAPAPGPA